MPYDAFISYSQAADGQLAPALQRGLQRLAKPWYKARSLRIFRDKTSLSAAPALWPSIEQALEQSRHFILLASPEAANSKWVQKEVQWWLDHRSPETILIALTGGGLVWSPENGDFEWSRTDALPDLLSGRFVDEPLYVDLCWAKGATQLSLQHSEFRAAILDLAAPLHGRPKEEVDSEEVRQYRRTRRLAISAAVLLLVLTIASVAGGYIAMLQRDLAEERGRIALARQLAAQAQSENDATATGLERSLLLATASLQTADTLEGRLVWASGMKMLPDRLVYRDDLVGRIVAGALGYRTDDERIVVGAWNGSPCVLEIEGADSFRCFDHVADEGRAVLSRDGGRIVADGSDGFTTVWSVETGELLLRVQQGAESSASWLSADNTRLVGISPYVQGAWLLDVSEKKLVAKVHQESILRHASFSPDGRWLATAGGRVRVWNAIDGKEMPTIQHADPDHAVPELLAFVPNSNYLVSGREVFDVETGERLALLQHDEIQVVSASSDGRWIATGGDYSNAWVRIWEVGSWRLVRTLEHQGGINALAFSPDSENLAVASYDPVGEKDADVRVWRIGSEGYRGVPFTEVARMVSSSKVIELRYSKDGRRLAALGEEGVLSSWQLPPRATRDQSSLGFVCAISADAAKGAIATGSKGVELLGLPALEPLGHFPLEREVVDLAFSRNGRWMAVLTRQIDENREERRKRAQEAMRRQFGMPAATYLNQEPVHYSYFIKILDTSTSEVAAAFEHTEEPYMIRVSNDGRWVAAAGADGTSAVFLFDARSDQKAAVLPHDSDVTSLAFHPNSQWLISGDGGRLSVSGQALARVWDLKTGRERLRVNHNGSVVALTLTRSGGVFASADMGGNVAVWDPDSGIEYSRMSDTASAVAFSPDEALLATASGSSGVNLWDPNTGQLIARAGHGDAGYARDDAVVVFSKDGRWLASARPDDTARVWSVENLEEVARFELAGGEIWVDDMYVDADNGFFAICGSLGAYDYRSPAMGRTLEVWDWKPDQMVQRACTRLTRELTETEWVRYMGAEPYRHVCKG